MVLPLLEQLGDKGYKGTHQRGLIIKALESGRQHATAYELYQYLRQRGERVGLCTIYRTLELLCTLGWVTKLELCERPTRYELTDRDKERDHHHHLVCLRCGKAIDFKPGFLLEIDRLSQELSSRHRFKVASHELTLFGYCQKCQPPQFFRREERIILNSGKEE